MSSGRLKASTNRVRTGDSLNSFWNNTIGVTSQLGANTAVEAYLNAPENSMAAGGGSGLRSSAARRAVAQDIVQQTGGFGDSAVNNYESLLSLARSQGALGGQNRGACKRCGQLGHLTKQCRNPLAAADGADGAAALAPVLPPVPEGDKSESSDLSLSSSSGSGSDSDSSSSGAARRRKKEKKEKARKRKGKEERKRKRRRKEDRRRKREKKDARRKEGKRKRRSSSSSD